MSKLYLCNICGEHHTAEDGCPVGPSKKVTVGGIALAALLGLTACGEPEDKDTGATDDTSVEDTDTAVDTAVGVMYGVPDSGFWDNDGDGYSPEDGDCDDDNPDINPDAREIAGDGVDSNCNGEDDT